MPPTAFGEKTVLMIRVKTLDAEPSHSLQTLSDEAFGTDGDPFTMVTQLDACSYGQFTISPFQGTINGNTIENGVYETTHLG